jgi:hypothetical protein
LAGQLREEIAEAQAQLQAVTSQRDNYQTQLENLPQLQETAGQVPTLQNQLQRLETVLRYPTLLSQTTVETQTKTGEDGQETQVEVRSNPFLDLALSSQLEGDAFQAMLNQLEGRIPTAQQPTVPQGTTPTQMNVPSQPQPVATTGLADLQQQYEDARNRGDGDESFRLLERMMELKQQSG